MTVCNTCGDTHVMTNGEREVMCTFCPLPCSKCDGANHGAYCAKTPCDCECHSEKMAEGDPMEDSEKAIEHEAKGPDFHVIKNSNGMFWGGIGRWTGTHYGACRYPSKEQALASMATIEANTVGGIHLTVEPYSVPEEVAVTAPRSDAGPGAEALEAATVRAMKAEQRVRELEADVKRWAERVRLLEGRAHAAHAALDGFKDPAVV